MLRNVKNSHTKTHEGGSRGLILSVANCEFNWLFHVFLAYPRNAGPEKFFGQLITSQQTILTLLNIFDIPEWMLEHCSLRKREHPLSLSPRG